MSIKAKIWKPGEADYLTTPFDKKGYLVIRCYEVNNELLVEAENKKTNCRSIFTVDGNPLYGGDHYNNDGFEVINGEPLLKAIHENKGLVKGNYYRRNGRIAFGGYNYLGGDMADGIDVYGILYCFINRRKKKIFSAKSKVVTTYYSLDGDKYLSVDEILSKHPVMSKLSRMGLLEEGRDTYDVLNNFLISCKVDYDSKNSVMVALNRSMEKIIEGNRKNDAAQRAAVSEALFSLRNRIEKHPEKYLEDLRVMQG